MKLVKTKTLLLAFLIASFVFSSMFYLMSIRGFIYNQLLTAIVIGMGIAFILVLFTYLVTYVAHINDI